MSCVSCGQSSGQGVGSPVVPLGLHPGEAIATACERNTITGSIPQIIMWPGFTLKRGVPVEQKTSNAGICNMKQFFRDRGSDCYGSLNARMPCDNC